jgi:hypothetical protein
MLASRLKKQPRSNNTMKGRRSKRLRLSIGHYGSDAVGEPVAGGVAAMTGISARPKEFKIAVFHRS